MAFTLVGWPNLGVRRTPLQLKLVTPKSKNIRDLSKRYLGIDITDSWHWGRTSADQARRKLNELIELRGELAHRIGDYFESGTSVRRDRLVKAIDFVERLAESTETAINEL